MALTIKFEVQTVKYIFVNTSFIDCSTK